MQEEIHPEVLNGVIQKVRPLATHSDFLLPSKQHHQEVAIYCLYLKPEQVSNTDTSWVDAWYVNVIFVTDVLSIYFIVHKRGVLETCEVLFRKRSMLFRTLDVQ